MLVVYALIAIILSSAAQGAWPHWRGPHRDGIASGDAPLHWSDTERIAWKAAVPGRGHSSPVVWGSQVFVTTAVPEAAPPAAANAQTLGGRGRSGGALVEHKFMLLSFDTKTGKLLWEKVARIATPHEGHHPNYGSFASNSPVTDGKHVIAFFGSRGVYCYTMDGQLVWEKDFGVQLQMFNGFGEGAWPALDGDKLLLVFDHQADSFLVALDKNTGRELWRTPRPGNTGARNWTGPVVVTHEGRKQVVVSASNRVCGYDLETGKLIWEASGLGPNTVASPVVFEGLVFAGNGAGEARLFAVRLGRQGDLSGTDAIAWRNDRGNPHSASPVLHDGKLYLLTDSGMLSCLDAKTGKPYYQQVRMPKPYNFKASPVAAGGKLYLASEDSDVIVVRLGEKFEVLATNTLPDQMFVGTPAISEGSIYLRGQNTLFCVR
jgi:outer membrane protein assembly factor BamB